MRTCLDCKLSLEDVLFYKSKYNKSGFQSWCKKCNYKRTSIWRKNNYERDREVRLEYQKRTRSIQKIRAKKSYDKLKFEVINYYGGKCECCGESEIDFLTIEHRDGDGHIHRTESRGSALYARLRMDGFKSKYNLGILCWNCNCSSRFGRLCPHKRNTILNEFMKSKVPAKDLIPTNKEIKNECVPVS